MSIDEIQGGEDLLLVVDDDPKAEPDAPVRAWTVLVVDDDDDVHETTRFALRGVTILERPLRLLHARSAAEAQRIMAETEDVAVCLVDVVMETADAGLRLVGALREAGFHEMRIVLRTGQPGYAPELSVISGYEIDDYRTKAELTQTRLLTVLTAAIRAYDRIRMITRSRSGLEMIVQSATQLFQRTNLELFSNGVLTQIAGLLGVVPNGIVCVGGQDAGGLAASRIVSAVGRFTGLIGKRLHAVEDREILALLEAARGQPEPIMRNGHMALHFQCEAGHELSALLEADCEIAAADLALLKLFSTNITIGFENLALVERLDRLAYIDPVLGVPNLNAFQEALGERSACAEPRQRMALVSVDCFHSIVAEYGPRIAHQFLAAVYQALNERGDGALSVARIGDGTFALLGDRMTLDERLVPAAIAEPFRVEGIDITTRATGAIIDLADSSDDPPSIMRLASSALMHVERTRRGQCVTYDRSMWCDAQRQLMLQIALKQAVETGDGLAVHLQPKVDLETGEVIGAEALLRWSHGGEQVSPTEFIPIAESSGLTQGLTDFVIHCVGRWAERRDCSRPLPVAVNLSMTDLNNPEFATRLLSKVRATSLDPESIEFEVTEAIAMDDKPWAIDQVKALVDAGFHIALDDFGTGYSSLGQFRRLPIHTLKIDRAFVSPLNVRTARHSLASIVLAMTRALEVGCIAEGIETAEQEQALVFLGCPVGQGFRLGRPVPIESFEESFLRSAA